MVHIKDLFVNRTTSRRQLLDVICGFVIVGSIQVLWCYLMYDVMMIMIRLMCVCVCELFRFYESTGLYSKKNLKTTVFVFFLCIMIPCLLHKYHYQFHVFSSFFNCPTYHPPADEVNISVVDTIMEMCIKIPHPIGYNLVSTYSGIGHIPIDWWRCLYA